MQVTPEIRYFAVARLARQIERMADDFDIHQLHDPKLAEMAEEIASMSRMMLNHCIRRVNGLE